MSNIIDEAFQAMKQIQQEAVKEAAVRFAQTVSEKELERIIRESTMVASGSTGDTQTKDAPLSETVTETGQEPDQEMDLTEEEFEKVLEMLDAAPDDSEIVLADQSMPDQSVSDQFPTDQPMAGQSAAPEFPGEQAAYGTDQNITLEELEKIIAEMENGDEYHETAPNPTVESACAPEGEIELSETELSELEQMLTGSAEAGSAETPAAEEVDENLMVAQVKRHENGTLVPQNQIPASALDEATATLRKENVRLVEKVNRLVEAAKASAGENLKLTNENKRFTTEYGKLKEKMVEMAVFNTNLAHVNELFSTQSLTEDEKTTVLERFQAVKTIEESRQTYRTLVSEMKIGGKPTAKAIVENALNRPTGEADKVQLNESVALDGGIKGDFQSMLKLTKRMEKVRI